MRRALTRLREFMGHSPAPVILMYHRISKPGCDPWGLCVSPVRFAEQMRALKAHRIVLPMSEFVARLQKRDLPPLAAAVTFDDGYLDNLTVAKPILDQVGVPATVFLMTGGLQCPQAFWWDELARLILGRIAEADVTVSIEGRTIELRLPSSSDTQRSPAPLRGWNGYVWNEPRSEREKAYLELWSILRNLGSAKQRGAMALLRDSLGSSQTAASDLPMDRADVAKLLSGPTISLGAHTVTHSPLTILTSEERRAEVTESRRECMALADGPVDGFAYPYGDVDTMTKELLRDAGFSWACSTRSGGVDRDRYDVYDLPRIQVLDWTSWDFKHALITARPIA